MNTTKNTSPHAVSTLEVDGTTVYVEGKGPHTVVLVHGWPDTHRLWDPQVDVLAAHHRCVRFTLPGFDLAKPRRAMTLAQMTAHFAAIVDAVSPAQPVTLLLHDWGAVFGYQYAMNHPARVARIVGVDIGDTGSGEFLRSLPLKAKLGIGGYQSWLAGAYHLPPSTGDAMTRRMAAWLRAPAAPEQIGAQMNHPYVTGLSGGFKQALRVKPSCPFLFFYGTRKPFMFHAPAWADRIAATPGNEVHALPTGHWVMVQRPEQFNTVLLRWLGSS
jgi:cis-3-alkyl-4-acyloxetan-2-one decarboxylase